MANTPLHIPSLMKRNCWDDYRQDVAGDSYNWSWNRPSSQVQYLAIHHSVTNAGASKTPRQFADEIAHIHINGRGWAGIGYHFVIAPNGVVLYVGDVGTARANVKDMNEKVIGICLVGDFTKHLPTDAQIISAHDLCKFFLENKGVWPNLKGWDSLKGHKELNPQGNPTACPGSSWRGATDSMFERIKNCIPYTAPQPQPTPVPQPPVVEPVPAPLPTPSPTPNPLPEPIPPVIPPSEPAPAPVDEPEEYELWKKIGWRCLRVFSVVFFLGFGEALSSGSINNFSTAKVTAFALLAGALVAANKALRESVKQSYPELYELVFKKLPF